MGSSQHEVVEDRHALEQGDVLERPGHAERGHAVRGEGGRVRPIDHDAAAVGMVEAADQVQHGRLAGAVRADH
jgi:hypothetical protein